MHTTIPGAAEAGPETRPRQPESEPGSEPVDRNVSQTAPGARSRSDSTGGGGKQSINHASSSRCRPDTRRGSCGQSADAASSTPSPHPLISASNCLTVLPVETEFDSKAQAVVHGSVDAVTEQNSTIFEAIEGMAVFDSETQSFWVAPRPKDKSGVVYDELSEMTRKNSTHPDSRKSTTCWN